MDYDALLWLSFGGPEGQDNVIPFLENVTRGRGVPRERLAEVAEHYRHFGGVSPINELNRVAIAQVEKELATRGPHLPVYFGNRNWRPMVEDTVAAMARDGVRRALVFPTSAYGGYSACRQYDEDIARARHVVGERAPELVKLRQFFDHPLFIGAFADAVRISRAKLPEARTVFVAHSIPQRADQLAGPATAGGRLYSRQIAEAARLVAAEVGIESYDIAWQSRSGAPHIPWLEPDILDHLGALRMRGVRAVVVCPIGFVSDHLEVRWDLDHEAALHAAELGMSFVRTTTPGDDPRFARLVVDLVHEQVANTPPRKLSDFPAFGRGVDGEPCVPGCCAQPTRSG